MLPLSKQKKYKMKLRIKEVQQRKNIKNVELAKIIDMTPQQVANYHSEDRMPPLSTLEKIASALNCEIAELLPVGEGFYHSYDENGNWQGIRKK